MVVVPLVNWHVGSVLLVAKPMVVGLPTVGVTMTVRIVCAEGPLQPLAVTRISTKPEKPLVQVTTPAEEIVPAAALLSDQVKPVLLVAVVAYVVVVVPLVS